MILTMIVECTGGVERRWARRGGTSRGTVGSPTSLLIIDLPGVRVPDHVDLLVLDGLVPVLPLLQRRGCLLHAAVALLQNARRIVLLLLLRIVHAIRPRVGLPLLGHEAARHVAGVWRRSRGNSPTRNPRRCCCCCCCCCYTTVVTGTLTKTAPNAPPAPVSRTGQRRCCDAVASAAAFRHSAPSVSVTWR